MAEYKLSMFDVTEGLAEALTVWSEFLTGKRSSTEWGVAGAKVFITELGMALPDTPIPAEDLRRLISLARASERISNNGGALRPSRIRAMSRVVAGLSDWMKRECDVRISTELEASGRVVNAFASFDDSVKGLALQYDTPQTALGGAETIATFNTNQSTPETIYDRNVPESLDRDSVSSDEYEAVGADLSKGEYWTPPPPAEHFDELARVEGVLGRGGATPWA